ncbi:MAG: FAD-binding oxidoreductase [Patescibacteria group bacterium]
MALKDEIKEFFKGEVEDDDTTLANYSRDASLFEVRPRLVVFPKDAEDIKALVKFIGEKKMTDKKTTENTDKKFGGEAPRVKNETLSITARSAGTCMSGGSLNESIIVDVTRHLHGIKSLSKDEALVLPGTFYRDFEVETLKLGSILPCYTASKNLCALGGMIANNAAGEKTLQYGKMENYVKELKVVFADGNEYTVKPLSKTELEVKMASTTFEGNLYKQIFELITQNQKDIDAAKPKVSKNSAGYYLWNVWDGETFDLTKLIVGSQGTLGIVTEAKIKLAPVKKVSKLFVIFMPNLSKLGNLVNEILEFKPESLESYDDRTIKMAVRFLPEMLKSMNTASFFKLIFGFIPEVFMMLTGGIPKMILLVEFAGDDETTVNKQMSALKSKIGHFKLKTRAIRSLPETEKYWTIRHESFNLLRKHVRGMRTAPFVDDIIVRPEFLPEFLPKMRAILDEYKLLYTIAGHAGNGNFHIIPLMDMKDERNRNIIREVSDKVYDLVLSYDGSITAEHNDGIVRTPYIAKMFGPKIYSLFINTKNIFDPENIFNPGKKVGGTIEYMEEHIARG